MAKTILTGAGDDGYRARPISVPHFPETVEKLIN